MIVMIKLSTLSLLAISLVCPSSIITETDRKSSKEIHIIDRPITLDTTDEELVAQIKSIINNYAMTPVDVKDLGEALGLLFQYTSLDRISPLLRDFISKQDEKLGELVDLKDTIDLQDNENQERVFEIVISFYKALLYSDLVNDNKHQPRTIIR